MAACEHFDIVGTGILAAAVRVVDERCVKVIRKRSDGHFQSLDAVSSLQRRSNIPTHNTLAVGIHNDCQEAESIAQTGCGVLYRNIGDVADPNLIRTGRYHALHEVGIRRQVMPRICRTRCSLPLTDVKSAFVQDTAERIASNPIIFVEAIPVYAPQVVGAHLRVFLPDLAYELNHKLL